MAVKQNAPSGPSQTRQVHVDLGTIQTHFLAFEPLASFFPASPPRPALCFGHGPAGPDPVLSLCLQPEQGQRQVLLSRIWPWVKLRFHLALLWLLVPCPWKRAALVASGTAWPCWVGRGGYRRGASPPCNAPLHLNMCTAFPFAAFQPGCEWSAFSGRRLLGALLPPLHWLQPIETRKEFARAVPRAPSEPVKAAFVPPELLGHLRPARLGWGWGLRGCSGAAAGMEAASQALGKPFPVVLPQHRALPGRSRRTGRV